MVVVHVRYGDIPPHSFSSKDDLPEYGQPPLPFYLSIFDFVKPNREIIVGEPFFEGPFWKKIKKCLRNTRHCVIMSSFEASSIETTWYA
jgi:hypothetical protein